MRVSSSNLLYFFAHTTLVRTFFSTCAFMHYTLKLTHTHTHSHIHIRHNQSINTGVDLQQFVNSLPKEVICCIGPLVQYLCSFKLEGVLRLTRNFHRTAHTYVVCLCGCVCVRASVCECVGVFVYLCAHMRACECVWVCVGVFVYLCVHMRAWECAFVCVDYDLCSRMQQFTALLFLFSRLSRFTAACSCQPPHWRI